MLTQAKDGSTWRIGTDTDVAWIVTGTSTGLTITSAIPPVFEAYATVVLPEGGDGQGTHDEAVLALLTGYPADQPWWLGYLDTGSADTVFPDAPMVTLYSGWHYLLVEAGPEQAASWRQRDLLSWKGALPDLMFPADRSWLVSTLWDDDWTCIGGPAKLVDGFLRHRSLQAYPVTLGEDATPPGHQALLDYGEAGSLISRDLGSGDAR
jgi:hypothetical protein